MLELGQDGEMFVGLALIGLMKYCVSYWMRERRTEKFERVGTVSRLFCFPIKSCKEVPVEQAHISRLGLQVDGVTDRQWMIIKPDNRFLSRKEEPKLVYISVKIVGDMLQLEAPGKQTLKVPKREPFHPSKLTTCTVHGDPVQGLDCGDKVAAWINEFLGYQGLRLVCHTQDCQPKDCTHMNKAWGNNAHPGDMTAFSNWCPYLACSESSLTSLNSYLDQPVSFLNFRPNVVIDGAPAFDEDSWEEIRIGNAIRMRVLEPCGRCPLTTVDPVNATKSSEPLKTLKKHRSVAWMQNKPVFGVNVAADSFGNVAIGDPVYVIRKNI